MLDKITFEQFKLKNGIACYLNPTQSDYTMVHIQVPRGSAHNTGAFLPGTFHFLEHLCCEKSKLYPTSNEFGEVVGLTGGNSNASTAPFWTTYILSAPDNRIGDLLPGFFSRVFEPVIEDESIDKQRGIVANERKRKERWYPGSNEQSWFELTQWKNDQRFSLSQILGSDTDLKNMNVDMLRQAHDTYRHNDVRVVAMGAADLQPLWRLLESLPLADTALPTEFYGLEWQDKAYRVQHFRDTSRHTYVIGGIITPNPDLQRERQLRFIMSYLINSTHGALYNWLRRDLGWTYGLSMDYAVNEQGLDWEMRFPVNSLPQVEQVRREWRSRALQALGDSKAVQLEVDRLLGMSMYWYNSPESIFYSAARDLDVYGQIVTATERREYIRGCSSSKQLLALFEQYWHHDEIGEYCAAPEKD